MRGKQQNDISLNLRRIKEWIMGSDFLHRPIVGGNLSDQTSPSENFMAVQLALTHLALDPRLGFRSLRTDYDMACIYGSDTTTLQPLISENSEIDLQQVLHIRNFWKRHLTNKDEDTFYPSYVELTIDREPKSWQANPAAVKELGTRWIGYYCMTSFFIRPFRISHLEA